MTITSTATRYKATKRRTSQKCMTVQRNKEKFYQF